VQVRSKNVVLLTLETDVYLRFFSLNQFDFLVK
jgi:hypothetical protein